MNAKDEFIEHISDKKVKCADIRYEKDFFRRTSYIYIHLKMNFSESDYANFLNQLNFNYDDGYGGQELYGNIWYEDGTWSSRGEYDGSEWWVYNEVPEIPTYLDEHQMDES